MKAPSYFEMRKGMGASHAGSDIRVAAYEARYSDNFAVGLEAGMWIAEQRIMALVNSIYGKNTYVTADDIRKALNNVREETI
jgi:hypothetical protein